MTERLFRPGSVTDEPRETATARKVAAIVATLTAHTITCSGLNDSPLPTGVMIRLLGYFHGFSRVICATWAITDAGVPVDATRFAAASLFPHRRVRFVARFTDEVVASDIFKEGSAAGRADGERYTASGHRGTALREMLATDTPVFCRHGGVVSAAAIQPLRQTGPD